MHWSHRQALSSLRHQLEPPGVAPGTVLQTDRTRAQPNPVAVATAVAGFEAALQAAGRAARASERLRWLKREHDSLRAAVAGWEGNRKTEVDETCRGWPDARRAGLIARDW